MPPSKSHPTDLPCPNNAWRILYGFSSTLTLSTTIGPSMGLDTSFILSIHTLDSTWSKISATDPRQRSNHTS